MSVLSKFTIRIPSDMNDKLSSVAEVSGESKSHVIQEALRSVMEIDTEIKNMIVSYCKIMQKQMEKDKEDCIKTQSIPWAEKRERQAAQFKLLIKTLERF